MDNVKETIVVVGDVTLDSLELLEDTNRNEKSDVGEAPNIQKKSKSKPLIPQLGGAFFVSNMIQGILPESNVVCYDKQSNKKIKNPIPQLVWQVKQYEKNGDNPAAIRFVNTIYTISPKKLGVSEEYTELPHPLNLIDDENSGGEKSKKDIGMLIVQDLGFYKKQNSEKDKKKWEWALDIAEKKLIDKKSNKPRIFIKIDGSLPNLEQGFWKRLTEKNESGEDLRRQTLGIIYADTLRNEGLAISKRISWERTAQDYLKALYTDPTLKELGELRHLVIRFGISGAIHSYQIDGWRYHRLFFDPNAAQAGIHRDSVIDGDVIGNQSIFLTSIIKEIKDIPTRSDSHKIAKNIGDAIRKAVVLCQEHFKLGLGPNFGKAKKTFKSYKVGLDLINDNWGKSEGEKGGEKNNGIKYWEKIACVRIPVGNTSWSIVNQSATYNLLGISEKIVMEGLESAVNQQGKGEEHIWAPIVKFGEKGEEKLQIIDRKEIESYRAVYRLLKKAIAPDFNLERPLSIAVFGPPGAGKSFVAEQIVNSLNQNEKKIDLIKINLSQLNRSEELKKELEKDSVLEEIEDQIEKNEKWLEFCTTPSEKRKANRDIKDLGIQRDDHKKKREEEIPCFFIDEFDCSYDKSALGWLKYFLSPMEDWKKKNSLRKCPIYIFAGGTSYTFIDFSKETLSPDSPQRIEFLRAKGPDFVSRLDGHINILGPDQSDDNDESYLLRRAIFLRSLIIGHVDKEEMESTKRPMDLEGQIGKELVNAMLKITHYKHGMRSMRAIFDMSVKLGGMKGPFVSGTLPPLTQLDMHVDGKEFMSRVSESK